MAAGIRRNRNSKSLLTWQRCGWSVKNLWKSGSVSCVLRYDTNTPIFARFGFLVDFRGSSNPFTSVRNLLYTVLFAPSQLRLRCSFGPHRKRKHDQASLFRTDSFPFFCLLQPGHRKGRSTASEPRFRDIPCWVSRASILGSPLPRLEG